MMPTEEVQLLSEKPAPEPGTTAGRKKTPIFTPDLVAFNLGSAIVYPFMPAEPPAQVVAFDGLLSSAVSSVAGVLPTFLTAVLKFVTSHLPTFVSLWPWLVWGVKWAAIVLGCVNTTLAVTRLRTSRLPAPEADADAEARYTCPLGPPKAANPLCYLDIAIRRRVVGRVVVEIKTDVTPLTGANFVALCRGEYDGTPCATYDGSVFHRVIKGFMAQGGIIHGTLSAFGKEFGDENFDISHEGAGVLSMANAGPGERATCPFCVRGARLLIRPSTLAQGRTARSSSSRTGRSTVWTASTRSSGRSSPATAW